MPEAVNSLELPAVKFAEPRVTTASRNLGQRHSSSLLQLDKVIFLFSLDLCSFSLHLLEVALQRSWTPGFLLAAAQDQGLVSLPALAVLNS